MVQWQSRCTDLLDGSAGRTSFLSLNIDLLVCALSELTSPRPCSVGYWGNYWIILENRSARSLNHHPHFFLPQRVKHFLVVSHYWCSFLSIYFVFVWKCLKVFRYHFSIFSICLQDSPYIYLLLCSINWKTHETFKSGGFVNKNKLICRFNAIYHHDFVGFVTCKIDCNALKDIWILNFPGLSLVGEARNKLPRISQIGG